MKDKRIHKAWSVLAGCCLMHGATMGIGYNTTGLYYKVVSDALALPQSLLTMAATVGGIVTCLMLPFVAPTLKKYGTRVPLTTAAILFCLSTAARAYAPFLYQWYISAILQGIASAFLMIITSQIIISNWFVKRNGFAMGVTMMFSGILGVAANAALSVIIQSYGYQTAYLISAAVSFLMLLPATLVLISFAPESSGLLPYGAEAVEQESAVRAQNAPVAVGVLMLPLILAVEIFTKFASGFPQIITPYAMSVGYTVVAGGTMVSFSMIGNIIGKIGLGSLSDRVGVLRTEFVAYLIPAAGYLMLLAGGSLAGKYAACVLLGFCMSTSTVMTPVLIRRIYGKDRFQSVFPKVTMFGSLAASLGTTVYSLIYERAGSYDSAIVLCALLLLTALLISIYTIKKAEKGEANGTE